MKIDMHCHTKENPNSFNLILPKEKMSALKQRFGM